MALQDMISNEQFGLTNFDTSNVIKAHISNCCEGFLNKCLNILMKLRPFYSKGNYVGLFTIMSQPIGLFAKISSSFISTELTIQRYLYPQWAATGGLHMARKPQDALPIVKCRELSSVLFHSELWG